MQQPDLIGVTEGADPTVNEKWIPWVKAGKPAVLITKSPRLLLTKYLDGSENVMVHCTITGLGGTVLEPHIDDPSISLQYYHLLCNLLGKDRIVLRIDPIIPLWAREYKVTPGMIAGEAEGRLRISFLDQYEHVKVRLSRAGIPLPWQTFHAPLEDRLFLWESLGKPEVCAEPGLPTTPCIGMKDCEVLGVTPSSSRKGQRRLCPCLSNKIELCKPLPRCTYGCLYCYWKDG